MARFEDLVDQNRRMNYNGLVKMVNQVQLELFVSEVERPFLVGKELYNGLLAKEHVSNVKTMPINRSRVKRISDDTKFFVKTQGFDTHTQDSITRAIFYLNRKPYSKESPNIITIGRHSDNDIVIADYSISRRHAFMEIYFDKFFISDYGSTNDSVVDGHILRSEEKRAIGPGSVIAFGRIIFMVMSGEQLYHMLRKEG